ncbi:hypothetical protein [Haloarchaeobius sp. HME9146]|uniref:hypothetical protein n=1 Tax=Haloarchaeobius sp. HME9146 TaxID=2978732 RepID=UPI0021C079C2|nr:hypothetical protein [Haloarchaeobius sp. HME9146]MCT9096960.1 hypothetical protein [Haloarchaeobius sp. HME9146]
MDLENSEIYIARRLDGQIVSAPEYTVECTGLSEEDRLLFCPNCYDQLGQMEPLEFIFEERRFIHTRVDRTCYQDYRTNDRDHPLIQQIVYKQLRNEPQFEESKIEYALKKSEKGSCNVFDVGAKLPESERIEGVVIEVQHQSAQFQSRLHSRVSIAQRHGYGFYIVFSPSGICRNWYEDKIRRIKGPSARVGKYDCGEVDLGTMLAPDDDISCLSRTGSQSGASSMT